MRAKGYVLTLAAVPGGHSVPLARALEVELSEGSARVQLALEAADDAFRASALDAVAAARAATGVHEGCVRISARGSRVLAGGSSAHEIALLAASALTGRALAPHFAIGHIAPDGTLSGGDMAPLKARAAVDIAKGLGWPAPVPFLHPARATPFEAPPDLAARAVPDVATSFQLLMHDTAQP